jgi:hypothetical protein
MTQSKLPTVKLTPYTKENPPVVGDSCILVDAGGDGPLVEVVGCAVVVEEPLDSDGHLWVRLPEGNSLGYEGYFVDVWQLAPAPKETQAEPLSIQDVPCNFKVEGFMTTFKFGDKVWDKHRNTWGLVIAASDSRVVVRPFNAKNSLEDWDYSECGKDCGKQVLFHDKPKEPRFAPGTPLVAKAKDRTKIYVFLAGEESDGNSCIYGVYDAQGKGLFPYKNYDFFVVGEGFQAIHA